MIALILVIELIILVLTLNEQTGPAMVVVMAVTAIGCFVRDRLELA